MPQVTENLDLADTKSDLDTGTNWVLGYKSVPNYWGESDSHSGGVDSFQVALFIGHAELFFPSTESEPVVTTERYLLCCNLLSLGKSCGPGRAGGQAWTIILGVFSYVMVSV